MVDLKQRQFVLSNMHPHLHHALDEHTDLISFVLKPLRPAPHFKKGVLFLKSTTYRTTGTTVKLEEGQAWGRHYFHLHHRREDPGREDAR